VLADQSRPTVGSLLQAATESLRASGSETARLDAELLLGHVLRIDRTGLLAAPEAQVGADHVASFMQCVARRETGEPVAYIRGIKEFYGLALTVDPRALIPRPETELLVELGIERLRHMLVERPRPIDGQPLVVWDVATGSGAVAIAIAAETRKRGYAADVRLRATDISADALALATENAVSHGVADRIDFAVADLAEPTVFPSDQPPDLLVANLPYIPTDTVPDLPVAASFEPTLALDGGPDGLDIVRRLLTQLPDALGPDGTAFLEIGAAQAEDVREAAAAALPGWEAAMHADLASLPRVVELRRAQRQ